MLEEEKALSQNYKGEINALEAALESERKKNYGLDEECRMLNDALIELKEDLKEVYEKNEQHQTISRIQEPSMIDQKVDKPKKKKGATPSQNQSKTLNQRVMDSQFDEIQMDNSTPGIFGEQLGQHFSSLQTEQRPFVFAPPAIVQKLIDSKLKEKQLSSQLNVCHEKEKELRQKMRDILKLDDKSKRDQTEVEKQLAIERIEREELEEKLREIEIRAIQDKQSSRITHEIRTEATQSECIHYVNTILALINQLCKTKDNVSDLGQDSVFRQIIVQLSRKIKVMQESDAPMIDAYMPTHEKDQKLWFLELLDSQLKVADKMTQRLFDFVKRLQVDIQGSMTSAAQIKATCLDLAANTRSASDEVSLLS